jgi:hypothetical protein
LSTGDSNLGGDWSFYAVRVSSSSLYIIIRRPHGLTEEDRETFAYIFDEPFSNREAASVWVLTENASLAQRQEQNVVYATSEPGNLGVTIIAGILLLLFIAVFVTYVFSIMR